eukprot:756211-Hanusia_phi.AAC.10
MQILHAARRHAGKGDETDLRDKVMRKFAMSSSWYLLWALNGNRQQELIKNPNQIPASSVTDGLLLGLTYQVKPREDLLKLALRFRTTIKSLLLMNPDVVNVSALRKFLKNLIPDLHAKTTYQHGFLEYKTFQDGADFPQYKKRGTGVEGSQKKSSVYRYFLKNVSDEDRGRGTSCKPAGWVGVQQGGKRVGRKVCLMDAVQEIHLEVEEEEEEEEERRRREEETAAGVGLGGVDRREVEGGRDAGHGRRVTFRDDARGGGDDRRQVPAG